MRNLLVYYLAILVPFIGIILAGKQGLVSPEWFLFDLFFYVFVYRQATDLWRLRSKGVITKITIADAFNYFLQVKHFRALYLP